MAFGATAANASVGCDNVNAGAFDKVLTSVGPVALPDLEIINDGPFDAGDVLHVQVQMAVSGTGQFTAVTGITIDVTGGNINFLTVNNVGNFNQDYTIPLAGMRLFNYTLAFVPHALNLGATATMTVTVTCTAFVAPGPGPGPGPGGSGSAGAISPLASSMELATVIALRSSATSFSDSVNGHVAQTLFGRPRVQLSRSGFYAQLASLRPQRPPFPMPSPLPPPVPPGPPPPPPGARTVPAPVMADSLAPPAPLIATAAAPTIRRAGERRAAVRHSRWSAWISGRGNVFESKQPTTGLTGYVASGWVGGDYRLSEDALLGAVLGYERSALEFGGTGARITSNGAALGAYAGLRLHRSVIASLSGAWMSTRYEGDGQGVTAKLRAQRMLVSADVVGTWRAGAWRFSPRIGGFFAWEIQTEGVDSAGGALARKHYMVGRAHFGPEIGRSFSVSRERIVIEPFAMMRGEFDFGASTGLQTPNGALGGAGLSARAGGGVNLRIRERIAIRLEGQYEGIGRADLTGWSTLAQFSLSF
jgi:outer membrane autotransporter protein